MEFVIIDKSQAKHYASFFLTRRGNQSKVKSTNKKLQKGYEEHLLFRTLYLALLWVIWLNTNHILYKEN